jgi:RNA polymerase sigma-70 factor, ECF subfamily
VATQHALRSDEQPLAVPACVPDPLALPTAPAVPASDTSFVEVFRVYAPYVLGLLRRLGVAPAELEDVAQEVFLAVHTQLPHFEGRSTLKTWLCGITLRKASEHRRKAYRRRERLQEPTIMPAFAAEQESRLLQDEQAAFLQHALAQLSDKQREVFVLYEIEELSMLEVAQALGCPRFTAYTRLHSARRQLRTIFTKAKQSGRPR